MADSKASLGPLEIEILRYIGDHYPISVAEVAEHVAQTTGQARTTVLTIMDRLRGKGYLDPKARSAASTAIPPRFPIRNYFVAW